MEVVAGRGSPAGPGEIGIEVADGSQQGLGVRVNWVPEEAERHLPFDDPSCVHNLDVIAEARRDAQVVGDENDGSPPLGYQP